MGQKIRRKKIFGGEKKSILPRKEYEDKHKLKIHLQEVSSVPSYPKPVQDDWLQSTQMKNRRIL